MSDVVLIGQGTVAARALRVLRGCGIDVPLVLADPRDGGAGGWRESLVQVALSEGYELGKSLLQPLKPDLPEVVAKIEACAPRVIFSIQCAVILRPPLISGERWWVVNWHNAPLPLLRGCDPFAWALLDGLTMMGVTFHLIEDEGIDCGAILAQTLWPIREDSTAWDLYLESIRRGEQMLRETAHSIVAHDLKPIAQDDRFSSYHPPGQIDFHHVQIPWTMPSKALSAWIRARIFPPFQMPYFLWRDTRVDVYRCRTKPTARGTAGTVLARSPLTIAAGRGALELLEVGWEGKVMSGAEWAEQSNLCIGEVFTMPS